MKIFRNKLEKLKKTDLYKIMEHIAEQDMEALPESKRSSKRFIWCFVQLGAGTLEAGFTKGTCFCKGGGMIQKNNFESFVEFVQNNIAKTLLAKTLLIEVEIKEMSRILRKRFQINMSSGELISRYKFYDVQESLTFSIERSFIGRKEIKKDKLKLTHKIKKQGSKKLRLP